MRRLALIGGWFVVVVLATALTWQIVSAADDRVSERPASPLNVAAPQLGPSDVPTTTTLEVVTTLTTSTTTSSSTSTTAPEATTSTSESAPTSPSATTVVKWLVKTTSTSGGTVVIKYRPDEVVLQAASPSAGFRADVEKAGPPDVRVEFESETLKVEFRAKWDQGELDVEVLESADD